jgi:hypothetical protein
MHGRKDLFVCPLCHYAGPFIAQLTPNIREHSLLGVSLYGRHRLQYLVMRPWEPDGFSRMSLLHYAPEQVFKRCSARGSATTTDMVRADVHYS